MPQQTKPSNPAKGSGPRGESGMPEGKGWPIGTKLRIGDDVVWTKGEEISEEEYRSRVRKALDKLLSK